jgi:APA family basic amino acid/polyamine antiporter
VAKYAGYMMVLTELEQKLVAAGTVLTLAAVNICGVRLGAGVLRWLTWAKLGLLAFLVCWGFGWGLGEWTNFFPFVAQRQGSDPLGGALVGGMVAAFFSFAGWWDLSKMAGEVREPGRTLPRALLVGVAVVTAVYILVSLVFVYLVPLSLVTSGETFAAQAGEALFGRAGGTVFSCVVIIAVLGSLSSVLMGAPRVYYAMARDGLFLPGVAAVHPRFGTPVRATALQAVLACVLVFSGQFEQVLAYFFFVAVVFMVLMIASLVVFRRRSPPLPGYRTPGYPWPLYLFLVPMLGVLLLLALERPFRVLAGVGVVSAGVPVYYLIFRGRPGSAGAQIQVGAAAEAEPGLGSRSILFHR